MSVLLSVTFACGLLIAIAHVLNRRFIAPVYDVVANLIAFGCAVAASLLLAHWTPAMLSTVAVLCWLVLARRTVLARREARCDTSAVVRVGEAPGQRARLADHPPRRRRTPPARASAAGRCSDCTGREARA